MSDAADAATLVTAVFAIAGALWAANRYVQRPKFVCGVLPSSGELKRKGIHPSDIGKDSLTGFRHDPRYFALRLRWPRYKPAPSDRDHRRAASASRMREVRSQGDRICVPMMLNNVGRRTALGYGISIVSYGFDATRGEVHIRRVETDGLQYDLSVDRPELLDAGVTSGSVVSESIARAKDEHFHGTRDWGDGVYAWGDRIETGSWDLILIEFSLGPSVMQVGLVLTVSCADSWVRDALYYQLIAVQPSEPAEDSGATQQPT
jgi:hypothetical protein